MGFNINNSCGWGPYTQTKSQLRKADMYGEDQRHREQLLQSQQRMQERDRYGNGVEQ